MENILDLLEKIFHFIKWPYFIGYTLTYNYISSHLVFDILWGFFAILILQDIYKKYKEEQKRKEETKE